MKILIIFISFILVFSMAMVFTSDMRNYISLQKQLKNLAEDCAEGGALTIDEDSCTISKDEALAAARAIINSNKGLDSEKISIQEASITHDGKGFRLKLRLDTGPLFRQGFISQTYLERISEYTWE